MPQMALAAGLLWLAACFALAPAGCECDCYSAFVELPFSAPAVQTGKATSMSQATFGGGIQRNMVNAVDKNLPTNWSVEAGKFKNIKWAFDTTIATTYGTTSRLLAPSRRGDALAFLLSCIRTEISPEPIGAASAFAPLLLAVMVRRADTRLPR